MKENRIKVTLLPHTPFLRYDGKFDLKTATEYSAKLAGECYEPDGYEKLIKESEKKTKFRENLTLGLEHQTPYEHINIGFEIVNLPKILAMVLNNERQCATCEKSARYTEIDSSKDPVISELEGTLYYKWMNIFTIIIKEKYGNCFDDKKIKKLAQENARYLISVFASTRMIHTVPLVQINRIVSYMKDYINDKNKNTQFEQLLKNSFQELIECFQELNILDERYQSNKKERKLSLFSEKDFVNDEFGYSYAINYKGSFAELAQAQRHRTIEYSMHLLQNKEYFIPPILLDDKMLVEEWLNDINSVAYAYPQGELISINESGTYEKFILKIKERLCTSAQQEIMQQTRENLIKYKVALEKQNHPLAQDIVKYTKGARCTFPDYTCLKDCQFKEGKTLVRRI